MRYRGTVKQPEREFWLAKWIVPADAHHWNRQVHGDGHR